MQRTISDDGQDWLNPAIFTFTDTARRKLAGIRATFPDKTTLFAWVTSMRVDHKDGTVDDLGAGLVVGLATAGGLPGHAFMISLDGSAIGIQIDSDATASAAPVIDTGPGGRRFVLR